MRYRDLRGVLASSVAVMAVAVATPAVAQVRTFNIPAQPAVTGIPALAKQADIQLLVASDAVSGKSIRAVKGRMTVDEAVRRVSDDAGLRVVNSDGRTYTLAPRVATRANHSALSSGVHAVAQAPQYDDIIVTAQKKEERITDVPIAMSAFSAEALDDYKIEGGSELLRAVPNVSFSKSNFASYNFSIRGIGTKALAASTDPAVAISFNNTPLIRNRLFEQEYFDVERVEVLRGPQGTLYGRNATGGVVNMITVRPKLSEFEGSIKGEVGNYSTTRLSGMLNVPIGNTLAIRGAGAWTKRDGFDFNTYTGNRVNGRDLWSARGSIAWEPSDSFRVTLIAEHFEEDDNRSRTGKQLCTRDPGPASVGGFDISGTLYTRGALSQGCLPGSIYDDAAFGVPNGFSLPQVIAARPMIFGFDGPNRLTRKEVYYIKQGLDPYAGLTQSKNLREINTQLDPVFRANNDVFQLNIDFEPSDNIVISSQSLYTEDKYYSTQDYYRFVSNDIFNDSRGLYNIFGVNPFVEGFAPDGVYTDPQLGSSRKLLGMDMVDSRSEQYYQELRIQSKFDGPLNFNIGANYTEFKIDESYYVFNNMFTLISETMFGAGTIGAFPRNCETQSVDYLNCVYVDPNGIENINGEGHNYFRSKNVSRTKSTGLFGEIYYNVRDDVKVTAGLRYTSDKKTSTPYKTQLLLAPGIIPGGLIGRGFVADPDVEQDWGRLTGRFVVDWKPEIGGFSDTLIYASYARGYKGGGANPPSIGVNPALLKIAENPDRFGPETVNSFELGFKGTSLDRRLSFGAAAFYYDYKGYQVSQIVDRMALNENFDSEMWGADLELAYRPVDRLKFNFNAGYLKTKIGRGEESIDVMDRTQGDERYMVVKPWMQLSSNCIVPVDVVKAIVSSPLYVDFGGEQYLNKLCGGIGNANFLPGSIMATMFGVTFDPLTDSPNQGRGFMAPLGGNELPNAPRWTVSLGAEYSVPIQSWNLSLRGDYYRQGSSWARVYNTEIDRLKSWGNVNVSLDLSSEEYGVAFNLYVKNVLNKSSITDVFLNSDDSALTANIFTVDPRVIGFSAKKTF